MQTESMQTHGMMAKRRRFWPVAWLMSGPWGGGGSGGGSGGGGNGGSPWGNGGSGNGPGGGSGGGSGGGRGRGPGRDGDEIPDIEELLRRSKDMLPGGFNGLGGLKGAAAIALVVVAGWLATGFYRVEPDQQGVVLTFGKWTGSSGPGLHWAMPSPIQSVIKVSVTRDNSMTIGGVTAAAARGATAGDGGTSIMLTGDENLVEAQFNVLWQIKDAGQFLFTSRDPEGLLRIAAESVMRQNVGQTPIQQALTEGRGRIEQNTQAQLQALLDSYGVGINVRQIQLTSVSPPRQVVDAFTDVQNARTDRERLRNEAQAYRNDILPRARGEAQRLLQEAEAYREEVVARASGDANRFLAVYEAYRASPGVTTQRIYIETMEEVLRNAQKVVIDPKTGAGTQGGVVPYLSLPQLQGRGAVQPNPAQGAPR